MNDRNNQGNKQSSEKSTFGNIIEIIGWLQIFASPFLIGVITAAFIYFPKPSTPRLVIAIIVAMTGLIAGIKWATSVWRKKGTIRFLSQVIATPEPDKIEEIQSGEVIRKGISHSSL